MRVYRYRGHLIRPCDYANGEHAGRWYVQTYHAPTGLRWEDSVCPHYHTLRDARDAIRMNEEESR